MTAFQSSFSCLDVRSAGRHREYRINGCVVEVSKPSQRANLQNIQLSIACYDIIANMHAYDTADDNMMNLIKRVPGQCQRAMEFALEMNG